MTYSVVEMHGAVTHFPVAMLIAAAAFEVGAPLFRKPEWRIVSFWLLVTAVVGSIPALITGWITGTQMFKGAVDLPADFVHHRLAAFITAGLAGALLLWRVGTKDKLTGVPLAASIAVTLIVAGAVSYTGFLGGRMTIGAQSELAPATAQAPSASTSAPPPTIDPDLVAQGKLIYSQSGCANCHMLDGKGGQGGPNLTMEAARHPDVDWQIAHLKNPAKIKPGSFMPPYANLGDAKLKALADYLVSPK